MFSDWVEGIVTVQNTKRNRIRMKICIKCTLELNLKNLNTFVKFKTLEKSQKTNIKLFRWTNFQKNHKISHNWTFISDWKGQNDYNKKRLIPFRFFSASDHPSIWPFSQYWIQSDSYFWIILWHSSFFYLTKNQTFIWQTVRLPLKSTSRIFHIQFLEFDLQSGDDPQVVWNDRSDNE